MEGETCMFGDGADVAVEWEQQCRSVDSLSKLESPQALRSLGT